jgi:hypothetical protein
VSSTPSRLAAAAAAAAGAGLSTTGSGSLGSARARRLSLVSEAAGRSLDADREGLIKGWIHDDASALAGGGGGGAASSPHASAGHRRLCVRWMDELIVALWHDLQAHVEWRVVDQALRETHGQWWLPGSLVVWRSACMPCRRRAARAQALLRHPAWQP